VEPAHQVVIFNRHYRTMRARERQYQLRVERFYETRVDYRNVEAFRCESLGRLLTVAHLRAYSEDGDIRAFAQNLSLSDLERFDLFIHRHADAGPSRISHRRGPIVQYTGFRHVPQLILILRP